MSYIILNGELKRESDAMISPVNRGLMYGDGCFETFRSYAGKSFKFEAHFQRLHSALEYLGMKADFDAGMLRSKMAELIAKNELSESDALIRIQCWREGKRGYITESSSVNWLIQCTKIHVNNKPIQLSLAKTRSIPAQSLSRKFKLSNGLNFILAAREAQQNGGDDALILTTQDFISETTISNIFWIHNETVFTPSEKCDLLPGITREILLQLMAQNSITVEQGEFTIPHLRSAEAVFCTNSVREIQKVQALDDVWFEVDHPLVERIKNMFENYKAEHVE